MLKASIASRAQRKHEFFIALIALLILGGVQLLFLGLDVYLDLPDMFILAVSCVGFTLIALCVLLLARTEKSAERADAIAESQLSH